MRFLGIYSNQSLLSFLLHIFIKKSMTNLIALPGGAEWIILLLLIIPWFLGIKAVLVYEHSYLTRIAFVLLALFIPPFAIIYWLYSKSKKPKTFAQT